MCARRLAILALLSHATHALQLDVRPTLSCHHAATLRPLAASGVHMALAPSAPSRLIRVPLAAAVAIRPRGVAAIALALVAIVMAALRRRAARTSKTSSPPPAPPPVSAADILAQAAAAAVAQEEEARKAAEALQGASSALEASAVMAEVVAAVDAAEEAAAEAASELKAASESVQGLEEATVQQEAAEEAAVEAVSKAVAEVEMEGKGAAKEAAAKAKAKEQAEAAVVAAAGAVAEPTKPPTRPRVGDEVDFVDTDGDRVAIKLVSRGVVDFYVNGELKIKDCVVLQTGSSLELRGIDVSSWLYKFSNGNFVEEIVEQTTPPDSADIERALKLLS